MPTKAYKPPQNPPATPGDRRENFARTMAAAAVANESQAQFEPVLNDLQVNAKTSLLTDRNTLCFIQEEDSK